MIALYFFTGVLSGFLALYRYFGDEYVQQKIRAQRREIKRLRYEERRAARLALLNEQLMRALEEERAATQSASQGNYIHWRKSRPSPARIQPRPMS